MIVKKFGGEWGDIGIINRRSNVRWYNIWYILYRFVIVMLNFISLYDLFGRWWIWMCYLLLFSDLVWWDVL